MPLPLPPDHELQDVGDRLDQLYQTQADPPRALRLTAVDTLGWLRWAGDYRVLRGDGKSHAEAWAQIERAILTNPSFRPQPEPEPITARQGRVRTEGRSFVDDGGAYLSCDFTDMSALRLYEQQPDRYRANCREMRARGATTHRILGMVAWPGREIDPRRSDIVDWTRATIEAGYALGVRTRLTMFADCNKLAMRMNERREHARKMAQGLRGLEHMIESIEVCNEPGYAEFNGPWTPEELVEIARLIAREIDDIPVGCGAPFGGPHSATEWTDEVYEILAKDVDLAFPHFDRDTGKHDGMYRPIRQPLEAMNLGYPFVNGEPIGPGASLASEENPGRLRAAATFTWMARGAGYCYHTKPGIGVSSDGLIFEQPGADVVFDGARILAPDTVQFQCHNWHWTSNPWETLDGSLGDHHVEGRGSLRTISGTNGGRFQTQVLRVSAGCTLRARWAVQFDVYHGGEDGPYELREQGRRVNAGETIEIGRCVDTVLIGRFV